MLFYHGTTKDNWLKIKKDKRLGVEGSPLYLASDLSEALCYGKIILVVEYDPTVISRKNNYSEGVWQHREYTFLTHSPP